VTERRRCARCDREEPTRIFDPHCSEGGYCCFVVRARPTSNKVLAKWQAKLAAYYDWLDDKGAYPDMQVEVDDLQSLVHEIEQLRAALEPLIARDASIEKVRDAVLSAVKRMR
jgi:late competence protein required for DNA uptake (superfamily II DNA/RNA helicase)